MAETTTATHDEPSTGTRLGLSAGEWFAIVAFWAFVAVLSAATRLVDPRVPGMQESVAMAVVKLSVLEYALWAVLTVPIIWLTSRLGIDGGQRFWRIVFFVALGLVLALLVDATLAAARAELLPPPRRGGRGRGGIGGIGRAGGFGAGGRASRAGGPFWFLDDLMVYFAILGAGIARAYFVRYQARRAETVALQAHAAQLQAQLAEARLAVLRTQLNPHFLFNTLNAVSALVERDPRGVRRMIARLSELLRHTLDGASEPEIPLHRELSLLERYVEIMRIRFQGRLEVELDVADDVRDALVPNLLLQPLVENAFKHGVDRVEGAGRIVVQARRVGDDLVLRVSDNGPGPAADPFALDDTEPRGVGGVGLRNSRSRLEELYGARQRLVLLPAAGGGTVAEVVLPYHTGERAGA